MGTAGTTYDYVKSKLYRIESKIEVVREQSKGIKANYKDAVGRGHGGERETEGTMKFLIRGWRILG